MDYTIGESTTLDVEGIQTVESLFPDVIAECGQVVYHLTNIVAADYDSDLIVTDLGRTGFSERLQSTDYASLALSEGLSHKIGLSIDIDPAAFNLPAQVYYLQYSAQL